MMLQLAFRNLWRRKRRTVITALSIAFGFWLAVILIGIRESVSHRFIEVGAKGSFGFLTVAARDFESRKAQLSHFQPSAELKDIIASVPEIRAAVPRRIGESILQSTHQNTGAGWMAVDPKLENADVNLFCHYLKEGTCGPEWKRGAIIGSTLAEKLKVKRDDELIYTLQFANGQSISLMTHVQGIFHTASEDLDGHLYLIPIDELEAELPASARYFSYMAIFVDNAYQVARVTRELNSRLPPELKAFTWQETQPSLVEFFAADRLIFMILLVFICLIIAAGIATCMNMNFIERRREIGTLLAIGMYPRQILVLLLQEALALGIVGTCLGTLITAPFYLYLNLHGVDISRMMGYSMTAGGITQGDMVLHCRLLLWQALGIAAAPILSSLLASLIPAYLASTTMPVEILREA